MNLSVLEHRLKYELPEEIHETIEEEIGKFEFEISRISEEEGKIGQATLTNHEISRLRTTNQHGNDGFTVIEAQCIKGAAMKYGVSDWTSKVDHELTYEENINLMRKKSTTGGQTMRELGAKVR